jgi:hypothetical protein
MHQYQPPEYIRSCVITHFYPKGILIARIYTEECRFVYNLGFEYIAIERRVFIGGNIL